MNLSEKEPLIFREKQIENKYSLSNNRRIINKIRRIKPKNLRKKISHKRIKKIDDPTTNDHLFFSSLTDISKETSPKKDLSAALTTQQSFLILAFLQPLLMQIYIALAQQKLFITYQKSLCNEIQFAGDLPVFPLATTATGFWQPKKLAEQAPNDQALPVMRTD